MGEIKIEKRITREDVNKEIMSTGDLAGSLDILQKWRLQELKDQQAKDAEFEIIQPKQLT